MKTALHIFAIVSMAIIVFALMGCDNPEMEPNQTEYMYSDLSIERAEWEIMDMMTMTYMYITLAFDEPVRAERGTISPWQPFIVTYDYMGTPTTKTPNLAAASAIAPTARGAETAVFRFSFMVTTGDTADMFSNVKLSYAPPVNTEIVTAYDDELKIFENRAVTKKGSGMGEM
jgi:uncharacterized lipoprotein NlpE involved in copper resistance